MHGKDDFDGAYRGPDQSRIPREIDPREYFLRSGNESLVLLLGRMKYRIAGKERWRDQDVIVLESEPIEKADAKISFQGRMLIASSLADAVVVRSQRIRYDDVGPEYSRQEAFNHQQKRNLAQTLRGTTL